MTAPSYEELRARLHDAEETLSAIRRGEVDALIVETEAGEQLFTLAGADAFYRVLLEAMPLGVAGLGADGTILFANPHLSRMLGRPLERLVGRTVTEFVPAGSAAAAFTAPTNGPVPEVAELVNDAGTRFPVAVTLRMLPDGDSAATCLIVGDLSDLQRELTGAQQRYQELIVAATEGVWATNERDVVTFANAAMGDLLGHASEAMVGRPVLDFFTEQSLPEARMANERHRQGIGDQREYRLRTVTGGELSVLSSSTPLRDADGAYTGTLSMITDAPERQRAEDELRAADVALRALNEELERRVAERTAELSRRARELEVANRELEAFSYAVAHDLRAPLRAIDGFTRAVIADHGDLLPAEAAADLGRVCAGAQRMAVLIDELLQLSRLSRRPMDVAEVDLSALAESVARDLREADRDRELAVVIEEGLVARGDPALLRTVLENLLGNAAKFTGRVDHPLVEFGRQEAGDDPAFYVRDNGVGFDMLHAGRLFRAFERLHTQDEFPGTGIGLVSAQRVVQRHGGRIWAQGALGEGATFFFTLGPTHRNGATALEEISP